MSWSESDLARWQAYDDSLSGLEAFCDDIIAKEVKVARSEEGKKLSVKQSKLKFAALASYERQAAVAYKTLVTACKGDLLSIGLSRLWVLQTPSLVSMKQQSLNLLSCNGQTDPCFVPLAGTSLGPPGSVPHHRETSRR